MSVLELSVTRWSFLNSKISFTQMSSSALEQVQRCCYVGQAGTSSSSPVWTWKNTRVDYSCPFSQTPVSSLFLVVWAIPWFSRFNSAALLVSLKDTEHAEILHIYHTHTNPPVENYFKCVEHRPKVKVVRRQCGFWEKGPRGNEAKVTKDGYKVFNVFPWQLIKLIAYLVQPLLGPVKFVFH